MTDCPNHQQCIDQALTAAQQVCANNGARLTDLRKQVLLLIWQNHKPLGAYTLIDMLAEQSQRRISPPTVYRALDFLLDLGLIHRIHSLNAYTGCSNPHSHQHAENKNSVSYFFICRNCHHTQEIIDAQLTASIDAASDTLAFTPQQHSLEVAGLCQECADKLDRPKAP